MKRSLIGLALLSIAALIACAPLRVSAPPNTAASSTQSSESSPAPTDDFFDWMDRIHEPSDKLTAEVHRLPLDAPATRNDAWPALSADGRLEAALARDLPLYFDLFRERGNDYSTLTYVVFGAVRTDAGADVYARALWQRSAIHRGLFVVADAEGSGDMVITVVKSRKSWHIKDAIGLTGLGTGGVETYKFPSWAETRAQAFRDERLASKSDALALAWALRHVPGHRLVPQPPRTFPDPHRHQPDIAGLRMLAPKYVNLTIKTLGPFRDSMVDDSYDEDWHTTDGRFHLRYGRDIMGTLLEDTQAHLAYDVQGPGHLPMYNDDGSLPYNAPVFVGHILVVDLRSDIWGSEESVVHYEIDCDTLEVIRAVPLGPTAINPSL